MRTIRLTLQHVFFCVLTFTTMTLWSPRSEAIAIRDDLAVTGYENLSLAPSYAAAGWLGEKDGTAVWQRCSGTLVATNKVLTAAHCLDENVDQVFDIGLDQLEFGFGQNLPGVFANNVIGAAINPKWDGNATYDLAVLTLMDAILGVTPAPLYAGNVQGQTGVMVGYGVQGDGSQVPKNIWGAGPAHDRLAAVNVMDVADQTDIETDFDKPDGTTNTLGDATYPTPNFLEGTTCFGDSGGPLFSFALGVSVVGVLSGGYNPYGNDCEYGDVSVWAPIRNDDNVSFLRSQGLSIPEPPVVLLLLMGLGIIQLSRRLGT